MSRHLFNWSKNLQYLPHCISCSNRRRAALSIPKSMISCMSRANQITKNYAIEEKECIPPSSYSVLEKLQDCRLQFEEKGHVKLSVLEEVIQKISAPAELKLSNEDMNDVFKYFVSSHNELSVLPSLNTEAMWGVFLNQNGFLSCKINLKQMLEIVENTENRNLGKLILSRVLPLVDELEISSLEMLSTLCGTFGDTNSIDQIISTCERNNLLVTSKIKHNLLIALSSEQERDQERLHRLRELYFSNPNLDSDGYYALLKSSILMDDFELFQQTTSKVGSLRRQINSCQYSNLLHMSALRNQEKIVDKIVNDYKYLSRSIHAEQAIMDLINSRKLKEAKLVLGHHKVRCSVDERKLNNTLAKIASSCLLEDVLEFCEAMDGEYNSHGFSKKLLILSFTREKWDLAWKVLELMHKMNCHIKFQYVWPILIRDPNEDCPYEFLIKARELNADINVQGLEGVVIPKILSRNEDLHSVVDRLTSIGLSEELIFTPLISFLVNSGRWTEASSLVKRSKKLISDHLLYTLIKNYQKNIPLAIEILSGISNKMESDQEKLTLIGDFLKLIRKPFKLGIEHILQEILKNGMLISQDIKKDLGNLNIPENTRKFLEVMPCFSSSVSTDEATPGKNQSRSSESQYRSELVTTLMGFVEARETSKVFEIVKTLHPSNEENFPGTISNAINRNIQNKALDEALIKLQQLYAFYPDYVLYAPTILSLVTQLVKNNRINDAKIVFKQYTHRTPKYVHWKDPLKSYVNQLLFFCSRHSVALTEYFSEEIIKSRMADVRIYTSDPIVSAYLKRGDLKGAVDKYEEFASLYKCYNSDVNIMMYIYSKLKDTIDPVEIERCENLLQRLSNIASSREYNFQLNMFIAALLAGHNSEAKKLLECNQESFEELASHVVTRVLRSWAIEPAATLLDLSKSYDYDKTKLCQQLILKYNDLGDREKAKQVKDFADNEGIQLGDGMNRHHEL